MELIEPTLKYSVASGGLAHWRRNIGYDAAHFDDIS